MSQTQELLSVTKTISIIEKMIADDILSEIESEWKDHWQNIRDNATDEQISAIELFTGKSIDEVSPYDIDFSYSVSVDLKVK